MLESLNLPSIHDEVSESNPVLWLDYLMDRCELRGISEDERIVWYGESNCNYILWQAYVFKAYGYNGKVLFDQLSTQEGRLDYLRKRQIAVDYLVAVEAWADSVIAAVQGARESS